MRLYPLLIALIVAGPALSQEPAGKDPRCAVPVSMITDVYDPTDMPHIRKNAEAGYGGAQYVLAGAYSEGKGIMLDPVRARMWYNIALQMHHLDVCDKITELAANMTPEQINRADQHAESWLKHRQNVRKSKGRNAR